MKVKTPWYSYYDQVKKHLEYPDISVYELLEREANHHLDYISYSYFGRKRTYQNFLREIDDCARSLKQLGVKAGECVSICMQNTPEAIISFYAINKIGAIANMIHPLSSENEIKYYLNLTDSKYIITIDLAFNKIFHIAKKTKIKKAIIVSVKDSMPLGLSIGYQLTQGRKIKLESSDLIMKWKDFRRNNRLS